MEAACVVAAVIENAASGPQGEPGSDDIFQQDLPPSKDQGRGDALPQDTDDVAAEEREAEGTSSDRVHAHSQARTWTHRSVVHQGRRVADGGVGSVGRALV